MRALAASASASIHVFAATAQVANWHRPEIRAAAATESGIGGEPDAPERHLRDRGDSRIDPKETLAAGFKLQRNQSKLDVPAPRTRLRHHARCGAGVARELLRDWCDRATRAGAG